MYAKKAGLQPFQHVLIPRTTGFTYLVNKMRSGEQLDAVYDVTVAYPKTLPQTELDVLKGRLPEEVHFHIKRHHASSLPSTDEGLKAWLMTAWTEKDELLRTALGQGHFPGCSTATPHPPVNASYLSILFWMPLTIGTAYLIGTWWVARWWCFVHSVFFGLVSWRTDGLQHLEVWMYRRQRQQVKRRSCPPPRRRPSRCPSITTPRPTPTPSWSPRPPPTPTPRRTRPSRPFLSSTPPAYSPLDRYHCNSSSSTSRHQSSRRSSSTSRKSLSWSLSPPSRPPRPTKPPWELPPCLLKPSISSPSSNPRILRYSYNSPLPHPSSSCSSFSSP